MVVLTEQREIWQVRGTSVRFPPSDVMRVHEDGVGTAGEAAVAVAPHEFPSLRRGRIAVPGPRTSCGRRRHRRPGSRRHHTPPGHGVRADQPGPFEFTRELDSSISLEWHVGHDGGGVEKPGAREDGPSTKARRVAGPTVSRRLRTSRA